ncbi:MAG TPA: hypothetical protein VHG51_13225 [Longimicrobiaceae bacterium]|nr:hypothetical protein [Longimicrobiaceae bacterium]
MTASRAADVQPERANRMYWNSSETVERIAEELGMSRNALYSAVQPEPAGAACPDCGEELAFPNRTSRTAGRALCLACDRTFSLDDLPAPEDAHPRPRPHRHPEPREGRDTGHAVGSAARLGGLRDGLAAVEPQRAALIGGAAVLGAVAGVAAVNLLRRAY